MTASVSLKTYKKISKKGYPVELLVMHQGKSKRRTIGHSFVHHWDLVNNIPRNTHPDYEALYGKILDIMALSLKSSFTNLTDIATAVAMITGVTVNVEQSVKVVDYLQKRIDKMRKDNRDGNADAYMYVRNQILDYSPDVTLQEVTSDYLFAFRSYKSAVSDKTIKNYIGVLQAAYGFALRDPAVKLEDTRPFDNIYKGLVITRRRKKHRHVKKKSLRLLRDIALSDGDGVLDGDLLAIRMSMLQFYLGGANLKDVYYLKNKQFYGNRVLLKRSKLGATAAEYDLKVVKAARKIFEKMDTSSDVFLFPFVRDNVGYKTYRRRHYRNLLRVQETYGITLKPTNENLTSNVFRHTFANLGKLEGLNVDLLRELMGHERNDIDTVYKDRFPEKVRDRAHKKIVDV